MGGIHDRLFYSIYNQDMDGRASTSTKTPGFNEYHHRFSNSYSKKTLETAIYRPSFTETVSNKKKGGFPLKLIIKNK